MLNREAKMKWRLLNNDNGYLFGAIRVGEVTSKRNAMESQETTEFCWSIARRIRRSQD